ncbi:ATP-binding protein [Streptomyces sp. NBC_00433]
MAERFVAVWGAPGEVARVRRWAQRQVEEFAWPTRWHPDVGVLALAVSELVTNALRYAGGPAGLLLVFDARRVRVVVSDGSPALPVLRPPPAGGWGLVIVDRLARSWGAVPHSGGKQVWADFTAPGTAPAPPPAPLPAAGRLVGAAGRPQECLSCPVVETGNRSAAPITPRRRWTLLLGAASRMLPPWPSAVWRACRSTVRKVESANVTPARSKTRWGW